MSLVCRTRLTVYSYSLNYGPQPFRNTGPSFIFFLIRGLFEGAIEGRQREKKPESIRVGECLLCGFCNDQLALPWFAHHDPT
jgi:hypothetical protein